MWPQWPEQGRAEARSPGTQSLHDFSVLPEHQQGTRLEVEQPGLELVPTWVADTVGGSLACAMVPTP